MSGKSRRQILTGLGFLAPNIIGVLVFTIFPVVFSLVMAFSNWDLTRHNMFLNESIEFVGFDNFVELVTNDRFSRFLGNTLFFMMGIPFAVGGSLVAAMLLSQDTNAGGGRRFVWLLSGAVFVAATAVLAVMGLGGTGMTLLLVGVAASIMLMGVAGGKTVYRTLFYMPHFVAGVATFILWKKLYNGQTGPVNNALRPVLDAVANLVNMLPSGMVSGLMWLGVLVFLGLMLWTTRWLRRSLVDGDLGFGALVLPMIVLLIPVTVAQRWGHAQPFAMTLLVGVIAILVLQGVLYVRTGEKFSCNAARGFGSALIVCLFVMVGQFVVLGLSAVTNYLPAMASDGLEPPNWLTDSDWAKPALMMMAFWAAIGSNNMLLYLAGLSNVPGALYEASDIDGASRLQKFWHVTWPQLAPTTFFIFVMSTIGGLQGGFEMARVMTQGGPAGATTTLSYFIYQEGFETGRLGYASAVAWALFILVFSVTLFNWKFGNRYVNE